MIKQGELLGKFRVIFEDGKSEIVSAKYATHAWSIGKHIRPYHHITGIESLSDGKTYGTGNVP
ncbi:MAG: hypothetical protein ACO24H_02230 [Polynucleobacter sp.]